MKKIVFILPNLDIGGYGGAERVAIHYIRQLQFEKYIVILIVFNYTPDMANYIPHNVLLVNLGSMRIRKSLIPLYKQLHYIRPDVIFTTHGATAFLLGLIKPFLHKMYHIARIPNMPSLEKKYKMYNNITKCFSSIGFKSADIIIAQTEEMRIDALKVFKLKESHIIVRHNPIDKTFINDMIKDINSPFSKERIIAVASGRLAFQKGFDVLIQAIKRVIEKYPYLFLYILGNDDGEGKKLKKLTKDLNLEKNIIFLGFIENPYPYYRYCDLFILSSRYEGFPNVLIENYYLNTPIVATCCIPIIKELIINGKNGFLCDVNNITSLSEAIINTLQLKRENILNPPYHGTNILEIIP